MSAKSVANGRRVNPVVAPPQQYMMVDTSLHRAVLPFTRYNLLFLHVQGIDTFFNLSTSPLHETILEFADAKDISVLNTARMGDAMEGHDDSPSDGRDGGLLPILSDLLRTGDWIRDTLVTLLTLTRDCKVLLISDSNICIDAIVLACSRRLQQWSATAWLSEFRFLAGRDLFDVEQFIESVDLSPLQGIVEGGNTPAFMRTYTEARRREESAASEGDQWKLWGLGPSVDGQKRALYERLLLRGSHRVTSEGMIFNANLSLINEKDDEVD